MKNDFKAVRGLKKLIACILLASLVFANLGFIGDLPVHAATVTAENISSFVSAVQNAKAGDVIYLKNGTYNNIGVRTISNDKGTAQNPVKVYAQTPGGVKFTGNTAFKITGNYIIFGGFDFEDVKNSTNQIQTILLDNAKNCTVEHNRFTRCGNGEKYGFSVFRITQNSQYNTIAYNTFDDSRDISLQVSMSSGGNIHNLYNKIHHNYFRNIQSSYDINGTYNFLECIQVGPSGNNVDTFTTIEYNLIENCIGDQQELFSIKTSGNTIRYNTFRNSYGAMYLRLGHRNTVEGNFFFNTKSGIVAHGDSHKIQNNYIENPHEYGILLTYDKSNSLRVSNSLVANNTIINPETKAGIELVSQSRDNTIANNFVMTSKVPAFVNDGISSTNTTYNKNLVQVSGSGSVGLSNSGITTTTGANMSYTQGLWRPGSDSSLINYGQAVAGLTDDMDGQARTGNPDCGADEYSTAPVARRPLTYLDVGVSWEDKSPLPSPTPIPTSYKEGGAFIEADGKVSIEAERADEFTEGAYITNKSTHVWTTTWKRSNGISGDSIQSFPKSNTQYTSIADSPMLTYKVKINSPGKYDLWVLWYAVDGAQDSAHVGLEGNRVSSPNVEIVGDGFNWQKVYTFDNLSAGYNNINFWARDIGTKIDKIYLTKAGDTPSGLGPAESEREPIESNDTTPPVTTATVTGTLNNEWYTTNATLTLSAADASLVSRTMYRINDSVESQYTQPLQFNSSGVYNVTYWSIDEHDNTEGDRNITIKVDKDKPILDSITVNLAELIDGATFAQDDILKFDYSVSDAHSQLESSSIKIDDEDYQPNTEISLEVGSHTVTVSATDNAGNEMVENLNFNIASGSSESNPPVTTATVSGTLNNGWYSKDVELMLSATDESEILQTRYTINDSVESEYTQPLQFDSTGVYNISYWSIDAFNNIEDAKSIAIKVDKDKPILDSITVNLAELIDGATFAQDDILKFDYSVSDAHSQVESSSIKIDDENYQTNTEITLDEGSHTVTISATDNAGNTMVESLNFNVELGDIIKPSWPSGAKLSVSEIKTTSVKLSWPEANDNVKTTKYSVYIDNKKVEVGRVNSYKVTGLKSNTKYTFKVEAYDAAGNASLKLTATATTERSSRSVGGFGGGYRPPVSTPTPTPIPTPTPTITPEPTPNIIPKDISEVLWAKEYIEDVVEKGIMSGYKGDDGSLSFRPKGTATRAEFATALFNYLGLSNDGTAIFEDIEDHWAKDYISKLVDMGIINGYNEKAFAPDEFITREQIATILNRTFKPQVALSDYKYLDDSEISDWAAESVYAVRAAGLMSGDASGTYRPSDTATRAEIATIFSRLAKEGIN